MENENKRVGTLNMGDINGYQPMEVGEGAADKVELSTNGFRAFTDEEEKEALAETTLNVRILRLVHTF